MTTASLPDIHQTFWLQGLLIFALVIFFSTVSAAIANYARAKGRNWTSFYFVSLLLSPVVAGTIVASVSETTHPDERVTCAKCATRVSVASRMCAGCGDTFQPLPQVGAAIVERIRHTNRRLQLLGLVVGSLGLVTVLVAAFQSDETMAKSMSSLMLTWFALGIGVALVVMPPARAKLLDDAIARLEVLS